MIHAGQSIVNEETARLISEYEEIRRSNDEKEKALCESRMYRASLMGSIRIFAKWASEKFGEPPVCYEQRLSLVSAGEWAEPLWKMLDDGASRNTVIELFRAAKRNVTEPTVSPREALAKILEEYRSNNSVLPKGVKPKAEKAAKSVSMSMDMDDSQNKRSKQFLNRITTLADEFIRTSIRNITPIEEMGVKVAKEEFTLFIREACDDFRRRVYVLRSGSRKDQERSSRITRDNLRDAAEVLGISVVWGNKVDLRFAKKMMMTRCAQLHPDKAGAMSDKQKGEYTAVVEAYKTFDRYMEGFKSHEDGERSHERQ